MLATSLIWGFAFLAQKSAMTSMGPLTFIASRYILGGLVILPFALREKGAPNASLKHAPMWQYAILIGVFFMGSLTQQLGMITATVTNAGFLTSLYVLFVPVIMFIVFRAKPNKAVYIAAPIALFGIFLLNGATLDNINQGDIFIIFCAVFWASQMVTIGFLARKTGKPIMVSAIQFLITGVLALVAALMFENPNVANIMNGWVEIAYAGILSTAVAFTLQAIGQQYVPPANTAIILSSESLFAAIGAALVLGERLIPIGYLGAGLIFCAILIVEVLPTLRKARST